MHVTILLSFFFAHIIENNNAFIFTYMYVYESIEYHFVVVVFVLFCFVFFQKKRVYKFYGNHCPFPEKGVKTLLLWQLVLRPRVEILETYIGYMVSCVG